MPYLKKDVGEFISLLQTGSLEAGRGKRAGLGIKFGNDHAKTRAIGTSFWKDRSLFDFQKTSNGKLLNWKNSDFVTLAVKDGNCFYDFAFFFTEDRIDKIWNDSEKGNRIQLFDVSFETGNQPFQNHNVPALPVHDSLIVPSSARELKETTFRTVFEHRFGVEFKFGVSSKV